MPEPATTEATLSPELAAAWEQMRASGCSPLPVRAIQVETSSICNFRCASCPLALPDYDRPEKHMSADEFRRVLAACPDVQKVELQGIGEVFLNPEVLELIRVATERGVQVHTFSNASVIPREKAFEIVRAGIHTINFSMDGADDPTFKRLRKGGTLTRYKHCFQHVREARAALGRSTPSIGVMSVLSKQNYRQVPRLLAIAEELGADTHILTKLNASGKPDQQPLALGSDERAWLDALPPYDGRVQMIRAWTPWTKRERIECYWPQQMAYITVEGEVTACCNHFDSRVLSFGNVFERPMSEIWNGERYRAFRRRLWNGDLPEKCRTC